MQSPRTLAEVLASVSDVLFPAESGEAVVVLDSRGAGGDTPLHILVWRRDAAGAAVLLAAGADVDAVGEMGQTPLHVALSQRDRPLVRLLVQARARTDIRSEFGDTAGELAIREGIADWLHSPEAESGVVPDPAR
jgi:uncharacterized protein